MKATFLSRYTPRLMPPEVLENIFVQRHELAQQLVELIRESVLTQALHHTLLTGPRGIGKTHLVSLIYYRICKMKDLRDHLLIGWLSEEEWSVTSFLDLLLCILEALQEESKNSNGAQPSPPLERVESLYNLPPKAAESAGVALLEEVIGNRTLLLIVENLDELFEGLGNAGQKQLCAFLQKSECCSILATAPSWFNSVKRQNSPLCGFFRHQPLEELNADDATHLLANIAKLKDKPELESFIQTPTGRDRIKAVHFLAGGNHRIYVIFSEFLTRESLDELAKAFMGTLDDLTPYYQERMRYLSPQQRKIIDFLCDRRHAVAVKEIAQRCFITHQTASSQLKDLRDKGYVTSESIGRESYYELREPLMRFCLEVKKQRGEPIQLFVEFLRLWYSRTELQQRLHRFAHADESYLGDTEAIVLQLFNSTHDAIMWRSRIKTLIEIYDKHQVASALGQGLVRSIPALMSPMVSDVAARTWLEVWQELTSDRPEFQIPLRLLNSAVGYRQTKGDPRVLLELPIEERELFKQVLGIKILNKWKASPMSYDKLRTLSFRLKPGVTLQHPFSILSLPGKSELLKLQAELKGRSPQETTIPITLLNKGLRALVPDLIYIAPKAGESGDRPWLYSATPINPQALHLILHAWVQIQFCYAPEQRRRDVLSQMRVEDLCWQDTTLNTAEWSTAPNGTAKLGSDDNFILLPHLLAASLSQPDVALQFGSEFLRFRRAPLPLGAQGAELVSWPPLQYFDKRGCWYWSVVITFTLHTVPFQDFPVIHCDISLRRWASLPNTHLPGGEETSVYFLTQVPWLSGLHHSNSFQVAPVRWEYIPAAEQQQGQPPYRLTWGSNLAPLLDRLNPQHPFPTPQNIIDNPVSVLNVNGSPSAALVYRNGIKPKHGIGPGLGPEDRRLLAEQIAELLAPEWEFVETPQRVEFTPVVPKNPFLPESKAKTTTPLLQFQAQRCRAIALAVGNQLTVEIWYQRSSTRDTLIQAVCQCLGIPESASFPYKFPDLEFTLDIRTQPLGTLGAELTLDPGINGKKEQRRQAIRQRGEELAAKVSQASGVTVAFVELEGAEHFHRDRDPKDALRRGFALVERLTQFISTDDANLSHRALNGFLDLLRQLGVQANPPKIVIKTPQSRADKMPTLQEKKIDTLPDPLHYIGLWLIKQNAPTSADGSVQRVPVMVHMASDTPEIKAIALGFDNWLPYREALLKIAKGEARGVARLEQAIPFIQQKLRGDVLPLGDTLLLCHAQNLRSAWSWLTNGNITRDIVAFGNERPFNITHLKGLRIVRVRDSQNHETPEWYAQKEDEHGFTKGIFQIGERVFASTYNKPKQFQKLSVNLSKGASWTTKLGKTCEPSPDTYFWNPGLVELTVACIQPDDEVLPWAAVAHELRHLALHYDEALKLPLPLHLAMLMEDYVLLIENDE